MTNRDNCVNLVELGADSLMLEMITILNTSMHMETSPTWFGAENITEYIESGLSILQALMRAPALPAAGDGVDGDGGREAPIGGAGGPVNFVVEDGSAVVLDILSSNTKNRAIVTYALGVFAVLAQGRDDMDLLELYDHYESPHGEFLPFLPFLP